MHTQDSSLLLILSNAHLKPWPKTNSQFLPQKSPKFIYEELKKKRWERIDLHYSDQTGGKNLNECHIQKFFNRLERRHK